MLRTVPSPHVKRSTCFSSSLYQTASQYVALNDFAVSLKWPYCKQSGLSFSFFMPSCFSFLCSGKVNSSYLSFTSYGKCRSECFQLDSFIAPILMHETVGLSVNKWTTFLQTKTPGEWLGTEENTAKHTHSKLCFPLLQIWK